MSASAALLIVLAIVSGVEAIVISCLVVLWKHAENILKLHMGQRLGSEHVTVGGYQPKERVDVTKLIPPTGAGNVRAAKRYGLYDREIMLQSMDFKVSEEIFGRELTQPEKLEIVRLVCMFEEAQDRTERLERARSKV